MHLISSDTNTPEERWSRLNCDLKESRCEDISEDTTRSNTLKCKESWEIARIKVNIAVSFVPVSKLLSYLVREQRR